jgi:hypothetical protein
MKEINMGYNRSGVRRTARMRRRKRLETRLAEKAPKNTSGQEGHGKSLKERAKEVVAKVEGAVGAAVDKVKDMIKYSPWSR